MTTTRRRIIALALALPLLPAAGCARLRRSHGYVPPEDELAQVAVGRTTRDELPGLIGQPGSQGLLTGSAWYYVGSRWEHFGMNPPREIDRQVVAVSFDGAGVVTNVERFGLESGRVVVLSQRVTDTGVSGLGVVRRLLRNIGNFNPGQMFDRS